MKISVPVSQEAFGAAVLECLREKSNNPSLNYSDISLDSVERLIQAIADSQKKFLISINRYAYDLRKKYDNISYSIIVEMLKREQFTQEIDSKKQAITGEIITGIERRFYELKKYDELLSIYFKKGMAAGKKFAIKSGFPDGNVTDLKKINKRELMDMRDKRFSWSNPKSLAFEAGALKAIGEIEDSKTCLSNARSHHAFKLKPHY